MVMMYPSSWFDNDQLMANLVSSIPSKIPSPCTHRPPTPTGHKSELLWRKVQRSLSVLTGNTSSYVFLKVSPSCCWGNWGMKRSHNLIKVTLLIGFRGWLIPSGLVSGLLPLAVVMPLEYASLRQQHNSFLATYLFFFLALWLVGS